MAGVAGRSTLRVLVTRAAHQASALGDALASHGLLVVSIPAIALEPPADGYASLHAAMEALDTFDWLLFTSANAVQVFAEQREELDVEEVTCRIGSIGAATSRALRDAGLRVDLQPDVAVAGILFACSAATCTWPAHVAGACRRCAGRAAAGD